MLNNELKISNTNPPPPPHVSELCGEIMEPFVAENFAIEPDVLFVDEATFEEPAKSLNTFKQYVNNWLKKLDDKLDYMVCSKDNKKEGL